MTITPQQSTTHTLQLPNSALSEFNFNQQSGSLTIQNKDLANLVQSSIKTAVGERKLGANEDIGISVSVGIKT
jgi:hypothetical protein